MKDECYLGLTGWFSRSHNASACIVQNGEIIAMAEEERFVRKKHAYDKVPLFSTLWCLNKTGLLLDDISCVALGWDYRKLYKDARLKEPKLKNLTDVYFPKKYFSYTKKPCFELIPHHLAHAACAYFLSGMNQAAILVTDGQGEDVSTTFAVGHNGRIKILQSFEVEHSLGYFYEAVGDFIGLGLDSPGKTMGLASYGEPRYEFGNIHLTNNGYKVTFPFGPKSRCLDQQGRIVSGWTKNFTKMFGKPNPVSFPYQSSQVRPSRKVILNKLHEDIAASAQNTLENTLVHLARILLRKTKMNNLCLSGGVALNCSANTKIVNLPEVDKLFIPPNTSDTGVSAGAALLLSSTLRPKPFSSPYLGPAFSNPQIKAVLDKTKVKYQHDDNIEKQVAKLIHAGKIVSWFQGAMEIGPRALGNRSILANPTLKDTHYKVNLAKGRERWRPLAPTILAENAATYLKDSQPSPFMLHTFMVRKKYQQVIPAVVHVDGSARPQTVTQKTNPRFYKLIQEFEKLSGHPLVLNTSFNGVAEPIVCTPMDALLSFFGNATDYLAIGNFLVSK